MDEISRLTAIELLDAYRRRTLSPVEVVNSQFELIEKINPRLNAIYYVDRVGATNAARASEARWKKGEPVGLLDGVPTTVKDSLAAKAMPTYRGSAAVREQMPDFDHPAVSRMKEHGAIILGKNTMCDYGILAAGVSSKHGVTRNPWNPDRTTGASSSGAAACLAAGIGPIAIGTDIVGSIRLPSSHCGLFGHKPSQGRVPYYYLNSPSLVAGPMARTVDDAALFMNVLAEPDERDFTALPYEKIDYLAAAGEGEVRGRKALLILDLGFGLPVDPEVRQLVERAALQLKELGIELEVQDEPPFPADADAQPELFYRNRCLTELMSVPKSDRQLTPVIYHWTKAGESISGVALNEAYNDIQLLREKTAALIRGYDYLLLPSSPIAAHAAELPAPDPERLFAPWCNTFLFNLTEQPACSSNCGLTKDGLPVGLQIVGRRFDDVGVLQLAKCYEANRGPIEWPALRNM